MAFNAKRYLNFFGFKKVRDRGENCMASCPDFNKEHVRGDVRPSWGIHKKTGVSHCFKCNNPMSLEQLTAKLLSNKYDKRFNEFDAIMWLDKKNWVPKKLSPKDIKEKLKDRSKKELLVYSENLLDNFIDGVHKSILDRGITQEAAEEWELKYDKVSKRTVIPVRNQLGGLVGATSRAVRDFDFKHAVGVPRGNKRATLLTFSKKLILFGEYKATGKDCALVVESPLDVVYGWGHGVGVNMDLFALMGALPSKGHVTRLMGYREVIIGLDNDKPGKKGEEILKQKLKGKSKIFIFNHYGKKDFGGISIDKLQGIYRDSRRINKVTHGLKPIYD